MPDLSPALLADLHAALLLLTERAPACLDDLLQMRRAITAGSPILHLRFARLLEKALETSTLADDERRSLGFLSAALNEAAVGETGYRSDVTRMLTARVPETLFEGLKDLSGVRGVDVTTLVREAVGEYLERQR